MADSRKDSLAELASGRVVARKQKWHAPMVAGKKFNPDKVTGPMQKTDFGTFSRTAGQDKFRAEVRKAEAERAKRAAEVDAALKKGKK